MLTIKSKTFMSKTKAILYHAPWCNGCAKMKPKFFETCKELGVAFELVDVEEPDGVERSIKHQVRNVPTIVFMKNGKEVGRAKGNESYKFVKNYA